MKNTDRPDPEAQEAFCFAASVKLHECLVIWK